MPVLVAQPARADVAIATIKTNFIIFVFPPFEKWYGNKSISKSGAAPLKESAHCELILPLRYPKSSPNLRLGEGRIDLANFSIGYGVTKSARGTAVSQEEFNAVAERVAAK